MASCFEPPFGLITAGELLVRPTASLAFIAYVRGTAASLRHPTGRAFGLLWLAGAGLLLVHLLAAFHFKHAWSHAAAHADTARQTREFSGLDWGGGLYLNYLLILVWLADAASRLRPNIPVPPLAFAPPHPRGVKLEGRKTNYRNRFTPAADSLTADWEVLAHG